MNNEKINQVRLNQIRFIAIILMSSLFTLVVFSLITSDAELRHTQKQLQLAIKINQDLKAQIDDTKELARISEQRQKEAEQKLSKALQKINEISDIKKQINEQQKLISDPTYLPKASRGGEVRKAISTTFDGRATAYDLSVESCGKSRNHPQYGITRTGTRAKAGRTVAVDPKKVPLGSQLYIVFSEPYAYKTGYYIAEDTGSAVRNNTVDIFFGEDKPGSLTVHKEALKFGVRKIKVYVIDSKELNKQKQKLNELQIKLKEVLNS